jgi:hypothetical protein
MVPAGKFVEATEGGASSVTMAPPRLVPVPDATQFTGLAQLTLTREPIPVGTASDVQELPPLTVS